MRGYMIEVSTDIESIGHLSDANLYESIEALAVDYVADADEEISERERLMFVDAVKDAGGEIGIEEKDDLDEGSSNVPYVVINDDVRRNYFRKRLERVKELAAAITLDQFAEIDQHDLALYHLKREVQDDYGDMVYFNGTYYTTDDFVRNVESSTKLYVGNVVMLH